MDFYKLTIYVAVFSLFLLYDQPSSCNLCESKVISFQYLRTDIRIVTPNSITVFQTHITCPQRPQSQLFENCRYGLSRQCHKSAKQFIVVLTYFCMFCYLYSAPLLSTTFWKHRHLFCKKRTVRIINCTFSGKSRHQFCKNRHARYIYRRKFKILVYKIVALILALLLLCGDVHPHPGPVLPFSLRHPGAQLLTVASWNVRTLLDTKRSACRPTAIVAQELSRYKIDIAALSETRVLGESAITEAEGGYTFFLKGKPEGDKCHHGVGFAVRTALVKNLQGKYPVGISERLMTMSFPLVGSTLSLISAYAPTLAQSDETKECFYGSLRDAIAAVPASHKLLVMGDFNARVGTDDSSWENIIGKHGVGNENSNGTLLLSMCSQLELCITNTMFQQTNNRKTTWMHPRTKQWHMIDYVITRQRDIKEVHHTRAMCGACTWSDHKLVRCKLALQAKAPLRRHRLKPKKKLDVSKLNCAEVRSMLATKLQQAYETMETHQTATASWNAFKDATLKAAEDVLGFPVRKHRDWFDENNTSIKPLLNQLHDLHMEAITDSRNAVKAGAYRACKQQVQRQLRTMQNAWWQTLAAEIQGAADRRDFKAFYHGLKAVHGPVHIASPSVKSKDGAVLTEPAKVLDRWAEHFKGVLNQDSEFDMTVLEEIPQWDLNQSLDSPPTLKEVSDSIEQLTSGKSPGEDGIPPEIFKHGGPAIAEQVLKVFKKIWEEAEVVQDFRDAIIVHLYKNKGDRNCCDNHRGIALLSIAGKVLARLMLNRLIKHIEKIGLIPESQCGFRPNRGTSDMTFALRQLQEKCSLQGVDLYLLFIDLTKAFDTVNREGLWCILEKAGCPKLFVSLIRSFHDNMKVSVREGSDKSPSFGVTSGTKQGCVLAPTLFSIFFSMMLLVAFKDTSDGVDIKSRFDVGIGRVKTNHFNALTKVTISTIRDLLFADDCALAAPSLEGLQRLCDGFSAAARRFGLIISIKKTEVLYQPAPGEPYVPPAVTIDGKQLKAVETFKYLGSTVSNDASLDAEITSRIAKATAAFGRLTKRLWTNRNIRLDTKIAVYRAAVITSLLFGCETWTLKKAHFVRLEKFHQATLRKIARIRWFHKVTNYEVLSRCSIPTLQSMIESAQLRWCGHVIRMKDDRIPKALFYGRLTDGTSSRGNHTTYLNNMKSTLRACAIPCVDVEKRASERIRWRKTYKGGIARAEKDRIKRLVSKRMRRKARSDLAHLPT